MNLSQLRFVQAVSVEGSFSRAADTCNVTQPTLSNGIALLEEEFGGQIFIRTTRKVELSPFGEQVLPLIQSVLDAQSELQAGVRAYYNPAHKLIRIGLSPLVDMRRLNQVLEPFQNTHRETEIFFKECFLGDLEDRLQSVQIDMMIRPYIVGEPTKRNITKSVFYEDDLYFLPRQAQVETVRDGGNILLEDTAKETFVLGPEGCGLAASTRLLFKNANRKLKEYSGQALSYEVMQEWADIGIGATILPGTKISPQFKDRALRLMIKEDRPAIVRFEARWMKGTAYPRHVAEIHKYFRQTVPKLIEGTMT